MTPSIRTRLSLAWRVLVAIVVLAILTLAVAGTAVLVAGGLAWLVLAVVALLLELTVLQVLLAQRFVLLNALTEHALSVVVVAGLFTLPVVYLKPVRAEIRAFQRDLGTAGTPAVERDSDVAAMAQRLAQHADIAEPSVYIANRSRPASYAVGGRADGAIVLTRGLVRELPERELRAVVAHEVSHLANGDSRIMNAAIVPLLLAEHVGSDDRPRFRRGLHVIPLPFLAHLFAWTVLTVVTRVQSACCRLGISALSRGREFAADRGGAHLTGEPAALASALRTLDGSRGSPGEDMRAWAQSASVLDILPHDDSAGPFGLFRTHPRTALRIERLEALASSSGSDDRAD